MWKKEHLELIMSVALILCAFLLAGRGWEMALGERVTEGTDTPAASAISLITIREARSGSSRIKSASLRSAARRVE